MRLAPDTLKRVDEWRAGQDDLPSRAAAIRRLVEFGLSINARMFHPSSGEKLIIAMLCDLYRHLKPEDGLDPVFLEKAAVGGHHWALEWEHYPLFKAPVDEKVALEVAEILDMWWTIEWSYDQLSEKDRAKLETDSGITQERIEFRGFDHNDEFTHYDVAGVMIDNLGRFRHFEDRDLDSHFPFLDRYRSMLVRYEPMKDSLKGRNHLTREQIAELLRDA